MLLSFQKMLPFLSTATVMFSGLVWVGMFTAFGRSTFTVLLMTGMVIRKMINSTNITSTRGVVLMTDITPGSSPPPDPTLIAIMVAPGHSRALPHETDGFALATRTRLKQGAPSQRASTR